MPKVLSSFGKVGPPFLIIDYDNVHSGLVMLLALLNISIAFNAVDRDIPQNTAVGLDSL